MDLCRASSVRGLDGESGEADADIPAGAVAADGQRDVTLGHHRCLCAVRSAGLGGGAGISAEHLVDVGDVAEDTAPFVELVLADAEAAALGAEPDVHGAAIVAGDRAGSGCRVVDRGPAVEGEGHVAVHLPGMTVI